MEQQSCLDRVLSHNDSVLITGAGGTGKTHTIRLLPVVLSVLQHAVVPGLFLDSILFFVKKKKNQPQYTQRHQDGIDDSVRMISSGVGR